MQVKQKMLWGRLKLSLSAMESYILQTEAMFELMD
jgi:hypothetical protein